MLRGGAQGIGVPPGGRTLQVGGQREPLAVQLEAWEAEVSDVRERRGEHGLGLGGLAVTVEKVFNGERRVFGRGARLRRGGRLGHGRTRGFKTIRPNSAPQL